MGSVTDMAPPLAVLCPPTLTQFPVLKSALDCNWYLCPGTALHVRTNELLDLVADWNNGGKSTPNTAPSLVAAPRELLITTEYVAASAKLMFESVNIR